MTEKNIEQQKRDLLKDSAFTYLRKAEQKMHEYACSLDVGTERTRAFEIYENVRNAARVR